MGTVAISHVSLELLKKIYGVNLEEHTIAWRRLQSRVTKNWKRTNYGAFYEHASRRNKN